MSLSLYDAVVRPFAQILPGVEHCLEKGRAHCASTGRNVDELVD